MEISVLESRMTVRIKSRKGQVSIIQEKRRKNKHLHIHDFRNKGITRDFPCETMNAFDLQFDPKNINYNKSATIRKYDLLQFYFYIQFVPFNIIN